VPGDVIVLPESREALVTARVEAERGSLAALLEVVTVSETSNSSDQPVAPGERHGAGDVSTSGPVRSLVCPYGTWVMRFWGPGATGEEATKYASSASVSTEPPSRSVPSGRTGKLSPPSARKLFTVTR
jgi:hypothetical protein